MTPPGATLTPETAFTGRLRFFMYGRGLGQRRLAKLLHIGHGPVNRWLSKGRFPKRKEWPNIIAAGIATEAELLAWRPRRDPNRPKPPSYWVRGARTYSLGEYAARDTAASAVPSTVGGKQPAGGASFPPTSPAGNQPAPAVSGGSPA